jgi:hypothetical protein
MPLSFRQLTSCGSRGSDVTDPLFAQQEIIRGLQVAIHRFGDTIYKSQWILRRAGRAMQDPKHLRNPD